MRHRSGFRAKRVCKAPTRNRQSDDQHPPVLIEKLRVKATRQCLPSPDRRRRSLVKMPRGDEVPQDTRKFPLLDPVEACWQVSGLRPSMIRGGSAGQLEPAI